MRGPQGPKGPFVSSQNDTLEEEPRMISENSNYNNLPMAIRTYVSRKDYQWMGDYSRDRLIEDFTQPQGVED